MIENKKLEIIRKSGKSGNYLVTIAIGDKYLDGWKKLSLPLWLKYCEKNDLGIIVIVGDLIDKEHHNWKKATWQKLLLGSALKKMQIEIENVCYLDTDILINPHAPSVFKDYDSDTIGLVSLRNNLPYPIDETLRREAFLRHTHYSNDYPLDSALFISTENLYKYHDLEPQEDIFCAGFFLFNIKKHAEMMEKWFHKYPKDVESITGGGDQTHLNFEFLNWGKVSWLDYRFQAIWVYEMAWKYPFLYKFGRDNTLLIRECIESSLYTNYFLHFAGSWYESNMWEVGHILSDLDKYEEMERYYEYLKTEVTGKAQGQIKPKK